MKGAVWKLRFDCTVYILRRQACFLTRRKHCDKQITNTIHSKRNTSISNEIYIIFPLLFSPLYYLYSELASILFRETLVQQALQPTTTKHCQRWLTFLSGSISTFICWSVQDVWADASSPLTSVNIYVGFSCNLL